MHLLPFSPDFALHILKWFYNPDYAGFFRLHARNISQTDAANFDKYTNSDCQMILGEDGQVMGLVQGIADGKPNRAFGMGMLIDKAFQGSRITNEATMLYLDYMFNRCGYRKCKVSILADNENLKKTLKEAGFMYEGRSIQDCFVNGRFVDELAFCMFSDYFNKNINPFMKKHEEWKRGR